jgi:hypothetical protein
VSRSPLVVGSAIDALIDHVIEIGAKTLGIDPRGVICSASDRGPGYEPARPNRP